MQIQKIKVLKPCVLFTLGGALIIDQPIASASKSAKVKHSTVVCINASGPSCPKFENHGSRVVSRKICYDAVFNDSTLLILCKVKSSFKLLEPIQYWLEVS